MISVVIPLYNKEKQIAYTLQSVQNQTFQDFEVVIVDDGSTDGSVAEVEKFCDSRIRLIHQKNAGVAAARNLGIEEAKGGLIAFLDADDEWKPEYLATQYHLFQQYPDCSVFACNYEFRDSEGKVTSTIIRKLPFIGEDGILSNYFEVASCSHPPLWTSAVMVKKQAIQAIGGFPRGVTLGEDLITWAKLSCLYSIAYSSNVRAVYFFRTQKELVTPRRAPDINDAVGEQLSELILQYGKVYYLREYAGLWHKMRMVTFLKLGMKLGVRDEYKKIKQCNNPNLIIRFWYGLSFFPYKIVRIILFIIAKIRS